MSKCSTLNVIQMDISEKALNRTANKSHFLVRLISTGLKKTQALGLTFCLCCFINMRRPSVKLTKPSSHL